MEARFKRNSVHVLRPPDFSQIELQRGFYVNRPVPRHWHEEYQLVFVESGAGDITYRGQNFLVPPASLYVVHPGEIHSNRAFENEGISFRTIFLKTEVVERIVADLQSGFGGLPFFPSTANFDKRTIQKFVRLHRTFEETSSTLEREICLYNFLAGLISGYAECRPPPRRSDTGPSAISDARDYLIANFSEQVSLEKLARMANLSSFHFCRVFAKQFGLPPHEFQTQVRLVQAKRYLQAGMNISQVAFSTGFADQSHLTRHFKRVLGVTPGQYR